MITSLIYIYTYIQFTLPDKLDRSTLFAPVILGVPRSMLRSIVGISGIVHCGQMLALEQ